MAILIIGNAGTVAEVDGTTFKALRIAFRPVDYGALGIYSINMVTGTITAGLAANSEICQLRWIDTMRLCALLDIRVSAGSITAFTAGFTKIEVLSAHAWTADGTGGTASTLTGVTQNLRASMPTTLMGSARIATTGALGAGTKTLDSQGIGGIVGGLNVTAGTKLFRGDDRPLFSSELHSWQNVIAVNEGVAVRATVPSVGTWTAQVSMRWAELTSF